jgi:hypothetical protein
MRKHKQQQNFDGAPELSKSSRLLNHVGISSLNWGLVGEQRVR